MVFNRSKESAASLPQRGVFYALFPMAVEWEFWLLIFATLRWPWNTI